MSTQLGFHVRTVTVKKCGLGVWPHALAGGGDDARFNVRPSRDILLAFIKKGTGMEGRSCGGCKRLGSRGDGELAWNLANGVRSSCNLADAYILATDTTAAYT